METSVIRVLFIVTVALLMSGQSFDKADLDAAYDRGSIVIDTGDTGRSACYKFDVWLAVTPEQQRRGLMHVRRLPKFAGMLFVYRERDMHSMWMKNTFIPLDILFIRSDGTVANVAAMTEPLSLKSIASVEPVNYVLELNGGIAAELGIDTDSMLYLPQP